MTRTRPIILPRYVLTAACIGMTGLFDWLFYGRIAGVSVAIFAASLLLLVDLQVWRALRQRPERILMILAAGLLAAMVEEPTLTAGLLMAMGIGTLVVLGRESWTSSTTRWFGRWIMLAMGVGTRWFRDNLIMLRRFHRHPTAQPATLRMAFRWAIPLALGSIFVMLFAVANPIIEQWIREGADQLWKLLDWIAFSLEATRILMWIVVVLGLYGLLRYRKTRRSLRTIVAGGVHYPELPEVIRAEWIIRCLITFNLVFAVQSLLDVCYLWGGAVLPSGMTYAQYAHRGAYPLVATALLAGLFVLLMFRSGGAAHRSATARRLVYAWILQNLFLLGSTVWRVFLYVHIYSLTRLRLAAMIWVALVAVGFVWIIWKILAGRSNVWLWRVNVATFLATAYLFCFVNTSGIIAEFNVRHCREVDGSGEPLDVGYLRDLGVESLPALEWVRSQLPPKSRIDAEKLAIDLRHDLHDDLGNWRGWTLRRARIARIDEAEGGSREAVKEQTQVASVSRGSTDYQPSQTQRRSAASGK